MSMDRDRDRPRIDRDLRELLTYLRDTFRDAASRIDDYIVRQEPQARAKSWRDAPRDASRDAPRDFSRDRDTTRDAPRDFSRDREAPGREAPARDAWRDRQADLDGGPQGAGGEVHEPLEKLREEVRTISNDAADMEHALLRLHVEAVTAETRLLQAKATDPVDQEIAARIMRTLTAIVSDHRPGHVYGLARHHQTDWEEMARRAREEIRGRRDVPQP